VQVSQHAVLCMQVLQERGETATRHGRATFAVLLLQDLAVVVLLMLVPLLSRGDSGALPPHAAAHYQPRWVPGCC
jgi:Kef-type K+ transport system membrane component KefB